MFKKRSISLALTPLLMGALVGCNLTEDQLSQGPNNVVIGQDFTVTNLSSDMNRVSGGSTRLSIAIPSDMTQEEVNVTLNGVSVNTAFEVGATGELTGVVNGLNLGENELLIAPKDNGDEEPLPVNLVNHPIEGPVFSGPHQTPFYCNQDHLTNIGLGEADENCMTPTQVSFKYYTTENSWVEYTPGMDRPADMAKTETTDGKVVDFIVRWERGTINRFIYSIAMLSSASQSVETPDLESWNKKLVFYFRGGVGVGHKQGSYSSRRAFYTEGLKRGYAVIFSSGTATTTHYNLQVGGETALMLKEHFIKEYAVPKYTTAVGQSGGAVQMYMYSQNHKGLLDGIIPAMSYPDMVTQTIHAGDCSLIERWIDFEIMEDKDSRWTDWTQRTLLEGFNASNDVSNILFEYGLSHPNLPNGSSECSQNWNNLAPLVFNPLYGTADGVTPEGQINTKWTHFDDARNVYGVAEDGYANRTWDNVGVQYGLTALTEGKISPEEFLDLNFNAGTWKQEADMIQEGCPFLQENCFAVDPATSVWPEQVDPWGARNFLLSDGTNPAPRAKADPDAIKNAYAGGLVNYGDIQIPTIDVRIYLEPELDMHNSVQSFAARQRMIDFDGDASNQSIWFLKPTAEGEYVDPVPYALDVMDAWLEKHIANPEAGLIANRPAEASDACFNGDGSVAAAGDSVWNGILDDTKAKGACALTHETFGNPRMVAGSSIAGNVFKCELQPVETAVVTGVYGEWIPTADQLTTLKSIFPEGVCKF